MDRTTVAIFSVTACCVFIIIFVGASCIWWRRPRTSPISLGSDLSSVSIEDNVSFEPSLDRISMAELLEATRNFDPELIIGDGSFGLVYKATLFNGLTVAVKRLGPDAFQGFREFRAELETLGKIRHPNIVRLLGYCESGFKRALVHEFMAKGRLDQWLHGTFSLEDDGARSPPRTRLSWVTRLNIIKGVASGLFYMHNLDTPIIHRDIKASNVLLDLNFNARIADFGIARMIENSGTHASTEAGGTMGYMPPEYIQGATMATVKGDVYSFGILMLEVATGRRPNWPVIMEDGIETSLINWTAEMVAQNKIMQVIDANISREGLKEEEVAKVIRIATMCTTTSPRQRPEMKEVVELLAGISS
ncbi:hypothetical protein RJ640_023643 [Escallonia rubra]|uniref:Protein kinase domain-containing protein n=1 Tax=Escallonia rubra TaxID=112253 RepID=A0AA88RJ68_9ASTE|nr:hypothetical protein RJ640_023643 [Escallonia rubra]